MGDPGVMVCSTVSVDADQLRFEARSHPDGRVPFVVLMLGHHNLSMHVYDVATLTALVQVVAEARDLLTAALAGQDPLPTLVSA